LGSGVRLSFDEMFISCTRAYSSAAVKRNTREPVGIKQQQQQQQQVQKNRFISPTFVSEFKYVFGRIKAASGAGVHHIYLVKRKAFYRSILDLFVAEGFIKGYKEFGELLIVYFDIGLRRRGADGRTFIDLKTIRWHHRRPSLRVKDLIR